MTEESETNSQGHSNKGQESGDLLQHVGGIGFYQVSY